MNAGVQGFTGLAVHAAQLNLIGMCTGVGVEGCVALCCFTVHAACSGEPSKGHRTQDEATGQEQFSLCTCGLCVADMAWQCARQPPLGATKDRLVLVSQHTAAKAHHLPDCRATVGEITHALEKAWGRYEAGGAPGTGLFGGVGTFASHSLSLQGELLLARVLLLLVCVCSSTGQVSGIL